MGTRIKYPAEAITLTRRRHGAWRTFDVTDGLISGVKCLLEDGQGYIWLGTGTGLCRFDGVDFVLYTTNEGLPYNEIWVLFEDSMGRLWVGTHGAGVAVRDGARFISFSCETHGLSDDNIRTIHEDGEGRIWLGTERGLSWVEADRDLSSPFQFHTALTDQGDEPPVLAIQSEADGRLWLGTRGFGLWRYDPAKSETVERSDAAGSTVYALLLDRGGTLWLGADGVVAGQYHDGEVTPVDLPVDGTCKPVQCIYQDRQDAVWVGTWAAGAVRFDGDDVSTYTPAEGMLNGRISGMVQDHTGCFWFGHTMAGLTRFHPYTVKTFSSLPLTESLIKDDRGREWFTDYTAICCIEDGELRRRDFGTHLYWVFLDSRGALWVGTRGQGVYYFADPDDFWRTDGTRFTSEHGLGSDTVGVVIETRDGVIWVGTGYPGSLCRFNGTGFESIAVPQLMVFRLFEKSDGALWFGGFEGGGVSCYDGERVETFVVQDGLPSNKIQSFVEDGQGRLWVGTQQGLVRLDEDGITVLGEADGFVALTHQCSACDRQGRLWFGTLLGGLFFTDGEHVQWATVLDGLPANSVTALLPQEDGSILVGTLSGSVFYRPEASTRTVVVIRQVMADAVYPASEHIHLSVSQTRSFAIAYRAIIPSMSTIRYQCMLEGYESAWYETWDFTRRYENLLPGEYTFRVRVVNKDLSTSAGEARMRITVSPDPREQQLADYATRLNHMETLLESKERVGRESEALLELARQDPDDWPEIHSALRNITEVAARALEVHSVGVWLFTDSGLTGVGEKPGRIEAADVYRRLRDEHIDRPAFLMSDYGFYVETIGRERALAVNDVYADPRTIDFLKPYFIPNATGAVLDAAIWLGGHPVGFVRCEHIRTVRTWHNDEIQFVTSIAELCALVLETCERKRAEADRSRLEQRLRKAEQLEVVGQLAGGVAHDFNNLLTAITGYTELLLDEMVPGTRHHDYLCEIERASRRVAALTRQLLAFSRRQIMQLRRIDLNALARENGGRLRELLGPDVDIRYELASEPILVEIDRSQFDEVLFHLAQNARDAMPEGGEVIIGTGIVIVDELDEEFRYELEYSQHDETAERPARYGCLTFRDTGCGMDDATRVNIFEPFFTTKEVGKGPGLGLSMVYGIVKQSDGAIRASSTPGQGTRFDICLPLARTERAKAAAGSADLPAAGAVTVLVVDDEEMVLELVADALRSQDYHVLTALDGEEALRTVESYPAAIEVLVTDIAMPRMGGRELADILRKKLSGLRILFISGHPGHKFDMETLREGEAFIQKPFRPNQLLDGVAALLGSRPPAQ